MLVVADLYEDLAKRLGDTLNISGGLVSNIVLDLLNRAQQGLQLACDWAGLTKTATLVVSATTKIATLPTDISRIIWIGSDTDGDGKIDEFYSLDGSAEFGYSINPTFVKATGHAYVLTFFSTPRATVKIKYVATLPAFAGTGTEYSFFPGDLLLLEAQIIHYTESGEENNQLQALLNRRNGVPGSGVLGLLEQTRVAMNYRGSDMAREVKDNTGALVPFSGGATLDGESLNNSHVNDLPSTDRK